MSCKLQHRLVWVVGFFAVAVAASLVGNVAHAAVPNPTAFEMLFSPNARVLDAYDTPQAYEVQYDESCDNPNLRIRARNKPAILIENEDISAAPITSFTLKINEGPFLFGTGDAVSDNFDNFIKKTIYSDAGVIITGSSVSPDAKTLTVTFDGLTAGKKAIFNIDLDTSDPNTFMFPDYRYVLFGAPLPQGGTGLAVGTTTVTFANNSPAPNSRTLTVQLPAQPHGQYMNEHIRAYQDSDKMEIIEVEAVPEPTAIVLTLAGVGAFAAFRRKSEAV